MNQNQSLLQPCPFFFRARAFFALLAIAIFGSLRFAIAFAFDNYGQVLIEVGGVQLKQTCLEMLNLNRLGPSHHFLIEVKVLLSLRDVKFLFYFEVPVYFLIIRRFSQWIHIAVCYVLYCLCNEKYCIHSTKGIHQECSSSTFFGLANLPSHSFVIAHSITLLQGHHAGVIRLVGLNKIIFFDI